MDRAAAVAAVEDMEATGTTTIRAAITTPVAIPMGMKTLGLRYCEVLRIPLLCTRFQSVLASKVDRP